MRQYPGGRKSLNILVSDSLSEEGLSLLRQHARVDLKTGLEEEELVRVIGDYDALIVRSGTRVTAPVIEAGRKLRVIGRAGVGVDNIDVPRATQSGIIVINVPGGNTVSAAEHTLALLASLARHIPAASSAMRSKEWNRQCYLGVELNGKTLGLVGLGRIGGEVARRARALGLKIIACDPYISTERAEKIGVDLVTLHELLARADFVSLHTPFGPATHHLIGAAELAAMKPGARLINCARGGLVDEAALYHALVEGKLAGAALDVFEQEPPGESPLLELENVIATPHLGALTREAQVNVAVQVAGQVIKALHGEPVSSAVNVPALLPEALEELEPFLPLMRVLGCFYMRLFGGPVQEIEICYSGEIASLPLAPLTTSCLTGLLEGIVGDQVNWVNAPHIARSRGIRVREVSTASVKNYSNLITLTVRDGKTEWSIAGTLLNHCDMRIVRIGDYRIEVVPSPYMLVTTHGDRPGVVGKVGTLLGEESVNIASMQLGRKSAGGEAMMVLQVDGHVPAETVKKLERLDVITTARYVEIPKTLSRGRFC